MVAAVGLVLIRPSTAQAKTFVCRGGDVQCLIAAITEANTSTKKHTIQLEAGTYTLVDIENMTDGANGLPSITGNLTIQGAGADVTRLERNGNAPCFRILHVAATGVLTLDGLTISAGLSANGGAGLFNDGGTVTITQTAFTGNRNDPFSCGSGSLSAGAIYTQGGVVTISHRSFTGNIAPNAGGGISSTGTLTITASTVVANGGQLDAGGIYSTGNLTIRNSTVARNAAGQSSTGAIVTQGSTYILNSTIVENSAGGVAGTGGIAGPARLQNTILTGNTYNFQPSDCSGAVSLGHNIIGDLTGCDIDLLPSDRVGDPGLGPYADDGTPGHGHYPLLSTSQAINAANPKACPKTDQLGGPRSKPCDIGAIEFQGTTVSSR